MSTAVRMPTPTKAECEAKADIARVCAEQPGIGHAERQGWWDMHNRWIKRSKTCS